MEQAHFYLLPQGIMLKLDSIILQNGLIVAMITVKGAGKILLKYCYFATVMRNCFR